VELISRDELKEKLDRGDDFKLVMVLGEWAFRAKRIPGSIHVDSLEKGQEVLSLDEEIVVYCSGPDCIASQALRGRPDGVGRSGVPLGGRHGGDHLTGDSTVS